jgi:DMSO/TMAO reductase YedYZ heme-binding membrane subunit
MVKLFIDFLQFLYTLAPLLTALGVWTLLAVGLSKSIKRHATAYYTVCAIPFALVAIPFVGRLLGIEMMNLGRIPFLGSVLMDYIHAGTLGFPLLIIVMYTGALNPKNPVAKKLLSIRKELSVLSGFPILTHSLIRVTNTFPRALDYFVGSPAPATSATNAWGAGLSNFSFVLGVLMLALFLPLWITSFDFVRKRMGYVRWKKLQRWSYVLYAMLFIHAMGIQVGAALNPRGGRGSAASERPSVEVTATTVDRSSSARSLRVNPAMRGGAENSSTRGDSIAVGQSSADRNPGVDAHQSAEARPAASPRSGGRQHSPGFADLTVGQPTKRYVHMASLFLIFGSYVYLRLRKQLRIKN